jgi:hypothetical protein
MLLLDISAYWLEVIKLIFWLLFRAAGSRDLRVQILVLGQEIVIAIFRFKEVTQLTFCIAHSNTFLILEFLDLGDPHILLFHGQRLD